ncbi:ABC transporter ATP-binding protein [Erwinia sp. S63]|uniref:zinc ABC transporter ATP-binding protein AztA n=1 Tax=Erwiniaceae TaxID=1903409 RepID=UPI00190D67DC|nr:MULTISPECIES: zinc ABC transporter ATP-binding protein AztA [Erwiniaceae]MBK0003905.1 ABC transporter ATP-binding protein [Erwinia sp. S38]MBK0094210.1 ABC transporter ATP-binding protein [Erwinia sp. S59]MBK0099392.1 ABC transporter ATP-binding protein [Erwinia sp. S63]MBK0127566.1 ABC transporter ATP-binding protein [Pantoea sp. S61]
MSEVAISLQELTLGYDGNIAIEAVSGSFLTGSLTAVIGPNGSGKSTLMKGIAGILSPIAGSCHSKPGVRIAYLPQSSELDRNFPANVQDLVSLGLWQDRGLLKRHSGKDKMRISDALNSVGLKGFEDTPINQLSGGQFQRALFARVIVQDASLILMDEPFNAIDAPTVEVLLSLIKTWHSDNRTVIVVIHDPMLVKQHFPETIIVNGVLLAWGETSKVLQDSHLPLPFCFHEELTSNKVAPE